MVESTLADTMREWVNGKLDSKFDYTKAENRNSDIKDFQEKHSKQKFGMSSVRATHQKILDAAWKNRGMDIKNLHRKTVKKAYASDMNAKVSLEPQAGDNETKKQQAAGQPTTQGTGQPQVIQPQVFDETNVAATINGIWVTFRAALPDLELLSEDEKKSLGALWQPMFNRYLTNDRALLLVPFLATAGIMIPKIVTARKTKKEKLQAEQVQDTPKKAEDTPPKQPQTTEENKPQIENIGFTSTPQIKPVVPIPKDEKKTGSGAMK